MRTTFAVAIAGVSILFAAAPIRAHHAFSAEFDISKPLKLQGTLRKWEMTTPTPGFMST